MSMICGLSTIMLKLLYGAVLNIRPVDVSRRRRKIWEEAG